MNETFSARKNSENDWEDLGEAFVWLVKYKFVFGNKNTWNFIAYTLNAEKIHWSQVWQKRMHLYRKFKPFKLAWSKLFCEKASFWFGAVSIDGRVHHLPHHFYICISCTSLLVLIKTHHPSSFLCNRHHYILGKDTNADTHSHIHRWFVKDLSLPFDLCLRREMTFKSIAFDGWRNDFLKLNDSHLFHLSIFWM